ncbi:S9 family peptidase [Nocardioides cynanchi]|uniref:S9 family peptidase n=1 Tax=Nocardioides cynanchi TaxID=2558918 RepID=UPI001EE15824|nr:prolyl oligopeptidase family serine peptidase [Nocardioides cynanchi]
MTSASETIRALLDLRSWVALDLDADGRVLAGHDDLGSMQLVEIGADGTPTPLTDLPSPCRGRYVPGRRQVVVEHDEGGDENYQLSLLDLTDPPARPVGPDRLVPLVRDPDRLHVLLDVTGDDVVYCTNRRNGVDMDVVLRSLDSGEERVAYDGGGYVVQTSVSHDTTSVAVTTLSLRPSSTTVAVASGGTAQVVTDPDELAEHDVAGWTADDAALVMSSDHERDHHAVVSLARDGGTWSTLVAADDHDLRVWLSPDGTAFVVGHHVDGLDTFAVHEADGRHRVDVVAPPSAPESVVWAPDSSAFAITAKTPTDPGSILRVDARTGLVTIVVDGRDAVPPELRDRLVTPTVHRIPAPDGEQIPCFRYASTTGASVVHVHGGPEGEATRLFSPVLQALALSGFDVLVPNVRGSSGYGKRWVSLDDVELRLDSVADLGAIHDWLPTVGLDPARSSLWGGSYGGYMVLAGVSMQPDRWAAGVDIVGMSSLVTFLENTSDYRRAIREREYGTLADDRAFLEKASPITYLDDIIAPLFVIHGGNDPRVPLSEAQQIKAALDGKGIHCELRVYDDEGHGLAKRANRLDAYPAAIDFLRHQLGTA